ncbi:MAG: mechanosensitive ion channel family protein [Halodesulfurarchaeum sp.]
MPTQAVDWLTRVLDLGWLYAAIVIVASYVLGKLIVRVIGRRVARRFQRPSLSRTVLRGVRTGTLIVGVLIALRLVGLPVTSIALSVTVFSAVLGLVLAPIVGSVINGVFVLADHPYEIGDMIELTDVSQRGFVEDITLRYTKIFTLENTFLVIPNSTIRERDVINYSAEDERTRLSLQVGVTYEGDLDRAREIMVEGAKAVPEVISGGPDIRIGSARYPAAPTCQIHSFGDHGVLLTLRYWASQPYRIPAVRSAVHSEVWERLESDPDVEIAYPHQHHVFDETSGTAAVSLDDGR